MREPCVVRCSTMTEMYESIDCSSWPPASAPVRPTRCSHHLRAGTSPPRSCNDALRNQTLGTRRMGAPPNDQEDRGDRGLSQLVLGERAALDASCDPSYWKRYWQRFLRLTGYVSTGGIATGAASRALQTPSGVSLRLCLLLLHGMDSQNETCGIEGGRLPKSNRLLRSRRYACSD